MENKFLTGVAECPTAVELPLLRQAAGKKPLRRAALRVAAGAAAGSLLLAGAGVVQADTIQHVDSVEAVAKVMPLNVGGPDGTTTLVVVPTNGDGKNGCNLTGGSSLTLNLASSNTSAATVSPASVRFTSCSESKTLTVTPVGVGSTRITATQAANTTAGTFNLAPAAFTVEVAPAAPSNTAPTLEIRGTAPGASYNKGSVPASVCHVTDLEDGPSTMPATLSAISGPDGGTGIGSQTASCSYTDGGSLTVASDVTYNIADATAPVITHTLTPAVDGLNGWYKTPPTLTWSVSDPDSPSTLMPAAGCETVTVNDDQVERTYTCSAASAGGDATGTASVKKDGSAPIVSYKEAAGTLGENGWYTSDVAATFTATDATSGPATATSEPISSAGEGPAVTVASPAFSDNAGNVTAAGAVSSAAFKIDKSAPFNVQFNSQLGSSFFGSTPAAPTCTAEDNVSGVAKCEVTGYSTTVGDKVLTATATDYAGNTAVATQNYSVKAWHTNGFYQPVDMGATMMNSVKGGSTVPVKFEVFAGGTEITDPSKVSLKATQIQCISNAVVDDIEMLAAGSTSLRYDATSGQFIYNWKTPTAAGNCYKLTMTAVDGTTISANFALKR